MYGRRDARPTGWPSLTLFGLADIFLKAVEMRRKSFPHNNFSSETSASCSKG